MRTEIGLISTWTGWLTCAAIMVVATIGKFGGTLAAARLAGHRVAHGHRLGVLMNTRGLMELIVLNVGPRSRRDLADALHDDGGHGDCDDDGDDASAEGAGAGGGGAAC